MCSLTLRPASFMPAMKPYFLADGQTRRQQGRRWVGLNSKNQTGDWQTDSARGRYSQVKANAASGVPAVMVATSACRCM